MDSLFVRFLNTRIRLYHSAAIFVALAKLHFRKRIMSCADDVTNYFTSENGFSMREKNSR